MDLNLINKKLKFSIILIILITIIPLALSQEQEQKLTSDQKASICIKESKDLMQELIINHFSIQRVNDSLNEAEALFKTHSFIKQNNGEHDFLLIFPYCDEIKTVKELAFESRDELIALEKFYNEFLIENMNTTSIDLIINEIKTEIKNERYEKVNPLIDKGYKEIVEIKSTQTTLNLIYKTTTKNIKDFFKDNWKPIVILFIVLIILFFIYKKAILKWWINRKIRLLEMRKNTLRKLIMKTQKDYFEKGHISEQLYEIKTKKFAELIRDIDRQIPLLREELVRIGGRFHLKEDQKEIEKGKEKVKKIKISIEKLKKVNKRPIKKESRKKIKKIKKKTIKKRKSKKKK